MHSHGETNVTFGAGSWPNVEATATNANRVSKSPVISRYRLLCEATSNLGASYRKAYYHAEIQTSTRLVTGLVVVLGFSFSFSLLQFQGSPICLQIGSGTGLIWNWYWYQYPPIPLKSPFPPSRNCDCFADRPLDLAAAWLFPDAFWYRAIPALKWSCLTFV